MNHLIKKTIFAFVGIAISVTSLTAIDFQDESELDKADKNFDNFEKSMEIWEADMEKWSDELDKSIEEGNSIPSLPPIPGYNDYDDQSMKLGLYLTDLDFESAYEKHYNECYGVLITGVVNGGNSQRAGLAKGDIIMEFDGEKVRYEDHLISLRDTKQIGDTVPITFFRNEKILTTNLTFEPYSEELDTDEENWSGSSGTRHKISVGYGGGGPYATFIDYDLERLNNYIVSREFNKIKSDALIFAGGSGMGNVGNGLFIGGGGAGLKYDQNITVSTGNERKLKIESGFGGFQVVKKVALFSPDFIADFGTMIGGGRTTIEIGQTDGNYSWDSEDYENPNNWYEKYEKDYFVAYPSIGVLLRIKSWFGIHASAGYLWTYSPKDSWKSFPFEDDVKGPAPDPIGGQTFSLGIWFGN